MSNERRWFNGALLSIVALLGLFIASRATGTTFYWLGLLVFLAALLGIIHQVRSGLDAAEGKRTELRNGVPIMLALVGIGTLLFHVLSPWWWSPIASNWHYIDDTINLTFWITGVVFLAVVLFTAYCVYRFRYREDRRAAYEPENSKLEWWLTIGTAVGVAAMLMPGLFVWQQFVSVPDDAHEVEIVGRQWSWSYRMPGADGRLGTSDVRLIGPENPLGLNPGDPNGEDDLIVEFDDLLLPVGQPVKLLLRSIDVLHNFYVPEFRSKMDMVPGSVTFIWFTPSRTGTFEVLCAELCGVGHALMRGTVQVVEEDVYTAWLAEQSTVAQLAATRPLAAESEKPADTTMGALDTGQERQRRTF